MPSKQSSWVSHGECIQGVTKLWWKSNKLVLAVWNFHLSEARADDSVLRAIRQDHWLVCNTVWIPWQQCGKLPRAGAQPYHITSYNLWSILQLKSLIWWLIHLRASLKSSVGTLDFTIGTLEIWRGKWLHLNYEYLCSVENNILSLDIWTSRLRAVTAACCCLLSCELSQMWLFISI